MNLKIIGFFCAEKKKKTRVKSLVNFQLPIL